QEVLSMLPYELCQRHRVLPMAVDGNVLTLGVLDDPSTTILAAARAHVPSMDLAVVHIEAALYDEVMRSHGGVQGWTPETAASATVSKSEDVAPIVAIPRLDA